MKKKKKEEETNTVIETAKGKSHQRHYRELRTVKHQDIKADSQLPTSTRISVTQRVSEGSGEAEGSKS